MADPAILARFDALNVWSRGEERAVNQPLLLLYALSRWSQGDEGDVPYLDVDDKVRKLLKEFGPTRVVLHPEYPFFHMRDDVWAFYAPAELRYYDNGEPTLSDLKRLNVTAGFTEEVKAAFRADSGMVIEIARRVLDRHFPESLHSDILGELGLSLESKPDPVRKRDPQFRQRVLVAYEFRCAVCGFDLKIGTIPVALDAAHIRWHQAAGPHVESNGLALCSTHHKLFDLGAFTVRDDGLVLVSDLANGVTGFDEVLHRYHGKPIRQAQRPEWQPAAEHLKWHFDEVFKGAARHLDQPHA